MFEWVRNHIPNIVDCGPIYMREALQNAGFKINTALRKHRWIPVEVILAMKE
jgi:demethylmenaquinone methyltransferase/2-methoxy-6-polyprenyl-1,4-benzoquinol methylase